MSLRPDTLEAATVGAVEELGVQPPIPLPWVTREATLCEKGPTTWLKVGPSVAAKRTLLSSCSADKALAYN